MSYFDTGTIDISYKTKNIETGVSVESSSRSDAPCRIETYDRTILSSTGKEEHIKYLVMIEDSNLKLGDTVTVKTIMNVPITKKAFDVKKLLYAGGNVYTHSEAYLG